jgi:hypothetical protein
MDNRRILPFTTGMPCAPVPPMTAMSLNCVILSTVESGSFAPRDLRVLFECKQYNNKKKLEDLHGIIPE